MTQVCNKCLQNLPLESFTVSKTKPKGRMYICKSCRAVYEKERRSLRVVTEEQRRKAKEKSSLWRNLNPQQNKEMKKNWTLNNKATKRAAGGRYRASKIRACPPWVDTTLMGEIRNFYWLAQDLFKVTGEIYHVDHIIPLKGQTVCGLHVPWNLQILPAELNLSKHNSFKEA